MIARIPGVLLVSLLLLSPGSLVAQHALVKAKVEECTAAIVQGDYEKVVDMIYPRLIDLAGGREALLKVFRQTYGKMEAAECNFDSAAVYDSTRIVTTKHRSFALVPYLLVSRCSRGKVFQEGVMLGVLEDNGKSWTFMDVGKSIDKMLGLLFPDEKDLARRLSLPTLPPARLEPSN